MLEGLDRIDWKLLNHAYGPADDVPDLIRALVWPDEPTWHPAIEDLGYTIYHQGTVYEATAYAVPFLIELLLYEEIVCRGEILNLLGLIAWGISYTEQHWDLLPRLSEEERQRSLEGLEQERTWVRNARGAVAAGYDRYVDLLQERDPRLRTDAIGVLVAVKERAAETTRLLWRTVQTDPDPYVRGNAIVGLSAVAIPEPSCLQQLQAIVDGDEVGLRVAAAAALACIAGPATPPRIITLLCHTITDPGSYKPRFGSPYSGEALLATRPAGTHRATALLLDGLRLANSWRSPYILGALLPLHFESIGIRKRTAQELTGGQREVLEMLLSMDHLWSVRGDEQVRDLGYGLPRTREGLRSLLEAASRHRNERNADR